MRETSFLGLTIQAGADLRAFLTMTRSPRAFLHVTRRMIRHFRDLALHGRAMQLRNGSALVARLMLSAQAAGVTLLTEAPALRLIAQNGRVTGAVLRMDGAEVPVQAICGVVLATGGFAHDAARRAALFPATIITPPSPPRAQPAMVWLWLRLWAPGRPPPWPAPAPGARSAWCAGPTGGWRPFPISSTGANPA